MLMLQRLRFRAASDAAARLPGRPRWRRVVASAVLSGTLDVASGMEPLRDARHGDTARRPMTRSAERGRDARAAASFVASTNPSREGLNVARQPG